MPNFDITITRTGGIVIAADNEAVAFMKLQEMSIAQIEAVAQLTGWEASDATQLEDD